jgi:RNase H-like domain found in reverse transcriptase/Integrase zinc binding domain
MSKKFHDAQFNYRVFEMETLAILEALLKWEDKLIGHKFTVVTDHRLLEFFQKQHKMSNHQARWAEYFSRFDFDITYLKGAYNKVAGCLSRYYTSDQPHEQHDESEYVSADWQLNPDGEELPGEVRLQANYTDTKSPQNIAEVDKCANVPDICINGSTIMEDIHLGYPQDTVFSKILEHPAHHTTFSIHNRFIYFKKQDTLVLCMPRVIVKGHRLTKSIIDHGHTSLGHLGPNKTEHYLARFYWWPTMSKDILNFCKSCGRC